MTNDTQILDTLSRIETLLSQANDLQRNWITECRERDNIALANQQESMSRQQDYRNRAEKMLSEQQETFKQVVTQEVRKQLLGVSSAIKLHTGDRQA